ncbi:IS1182 family transposase [Prevotella histicola]
MTKIHFRSYIHKKIILFPQRIDKDIAEDDPVRLLDALVDNLMLDNVYKLYKPSGRKPYHPQMMLKVILYAYMNNIYSCRRIESLLKRDIHFIYLAGYEQPDFITINRFRNRVRKEINNIFTQVVLVLAAKGLISLDIEYIDGTKIESKANKYTFVWKRTVEKNRAKLQEQIRTLLLQVDDVIAQDNAAKREGVEFTAALLDEISEELNKSLESLPEPKTKEEKQAVRTKKRQTKPGYNLQIATENQFITDFALYANRTDTLTLPSFLESFKSRYHRYAKTVVADSGYGSEENYLFIDVHNMEAYVKYNYFHKEQRPRYTPNPFSPASLYYNKEQDFYVCPMGQHMKRIGMKRSLTSNGFVTYSVRYQAERCDGCPLRGSCFKARGNKIIEVNHQLQHYKQKARELLTSEEGIKHRGRRYIEPEAVFGQTKYNKAYKRFRHFGKDKVNMDFAFFAIAFNIGKMCRKTNLKELKAVMELLLGTFRCSIQVYIGYLKPYKSFYMKLAA